MPHFRGVQKWTPFDSSEGVRSPEKGKWCHYPVVKPTYWKKKRVGEKLQKAWGGKARSSNSRLKLPVLYKGGKNTPEM